MALYALGRREFAASFDAHDPLLRDNMIELETFLKYEKHFRNLHLQESRLRRRYTAELKELRDLRRERAERDKATGEDCPRTVTSRAAAPEPREFEFSTARTKFTQTAEYQKAELESLAGIAQLALENVA
jgi:hypothetical protein